MSFIDSAQSAYEHAADLQVEARDIDIVLLRLGGIYLSNEEYEAARNIFMRRCARNASANAWFGLGVACYRLGELTEAEEALAEANMYDNTFPEVRH